ncbi:MAG: protease, partial [Bacteroidetes bacterium]|nr:protease [Bacteroidota bacterium]
DAPRAIDLPGPTFYYTPAWSPEGTHILFTDTDLNLWVLEVESGEATLVDTDQYAHPVRSLDPVWSPDGQWIAYSKRLDNLFRAIMVYSMETGETHQVTDGMSDAMSPAWDAGGTYLYFLASTNLGLNTGWLDMSSYQRPVERGVYLTVLQADEPSPLLPESDEEPVESEDDNGENDADDDNGNGDAEEDDGEEEMAVEIDLDGLQQRILAIDVPLRDYGAIQAGTEGMVFYTEDIPNQPGVTLHRYSLDDREATKLMDGVQRFDLSDDGQKLLYQASGGWGIVDAAGSPSPGDGALTLDLRAKIDPAKEWEQIFDEAWRFQRDYLYVENLHGADWDQVYAMYRPWVEHVRHRDDLNYVLDIMGGEVSVGHSYTGGGDYPDVDRVPVGLLGADFEIEDGAYRIARIYTGENWNPDLRAPLSAPGVNVSEGDYLVGVDGEALTAATNLFSAFEQTAGRQTILHVNDRPTMEGARTVTVVPVSNETDLRRRAWVEDNRRTVSEMSDGQLAYVYLPNTAGAGYEYFNRYYFAQQDKAGVVIDERFNGGGSAADYMIDIMARELHGYFNNPVEDRTPWTTPMAGIWGPKVMIINESAGSGGDLLPYMFRRMDLGPLVGTRTWGGLVGIWDTPPLIDGGGITAPRGGFFDLDGNWAVENEGVAPDIEVEMTPKDVAAGRDPQLERAVQEALRLLEENPVQLEEEPPPPVRVLRPEDG